MEVFSGDSSVVDYWRSRKFRGAPVKLLGTVLAPCSLFDGLSEFHFVAWEIRMMDQVSTISVVADLVRSTNRPEVLIEAAGLAGFLGYKAGVRLRAISNAALVARLSEWDSCLGATWDHPSVNLLESLIDVNGALGVPFAVSKVKHLTAGGQELLECKACHGPGLRMVEALWLETQAR